MDGGFYFHNNIIKRDLSILKIIDGKDLTIVSTGPQLRNAIDARRELSLKGWNAEILYVHTIHPLDTTLIRSSVEKTKRVLVVEEHNRFGGLANDILCNLYDIRDLQYSSISIKSFIHDYGTYEEHCLNLGLSVEGIVNAVERDMTK